MLVWHKKLECKFCALANITIFIKTQKMGHIKSIMQNIRYKQKIGKVGSVHPKVKSSK